MILGDSILSQLWDQFEREAILYSRKLERQAKEDFSVGVEVGVERSLVNTNPLQALAKEKTSDKLPVESYFNFLNMTDYNNKNCKEPFKGWGPIQNDFPTLNLTVYSVTHGQPVCKNFCSAKTIYSSDVIDRMVEHEWFSKRTRGVPAYEADQEQYIVLFDHGAHFALFNPIVFYNRLLEIKNSIIEYKKHSPKTLFIYKTLNYCRGNFTALWSVQSSFQALRMREIAFKVFGNPHNEDILDDERYPVKVLDVFPMTLAAFEFNVIGDTHPPVGLLKKGISDYLVDFLKYLGGFEERAKETSGGFGNRFSTKF